MDDMKELFQYIFIDMAEPIRYIPYGIILGIIVVMIMGRSGAKRCFVFLWAVYLSVIIIMTLLSRGPGSRIGVDMRLFGTWGASAQSRAYVIENVLLFIPFGIMFPLIGSFFVKVHICVATAALFSIIIETIQYVTGCGFCQLDDVVMNTLGACIGWLGWWICKGRIR